MSDSTLGTAGKADVRRPDAGLGLVEIVVSMFLLTIVIVAMVPLLLNGAKISTNSARVATATQLVSQRLDIARSSAASCAALRNVAAVSLTPVVDSTGATYRQTQTVGACPTAFPALVAYSTRVTVNNKQLSTATMSVLVTGA